MKKIVTLVFGMLMWNMMNAQAPVSWTSADMYQAIQKLNVLGSVLYVAAHPDDENTRLIAYLSKSKLYRTGYLSMTRGDGGQNLIGDEQGVELGLIRTQELLAARRIDGGEQFFTRAYDFGYSKTPDETFEKWNHEKILGDVVWVIRKFQPDIIITRFPTTGEGGHGHHTASSILANEAFTAAADANRFPEQLKYVKTWQAKRLLWNTFNFGGNNTTRDDQLKIDVGGYNPLLGKSYGEIAAEGRSQHKSQGFGVSASRGEQFEFFSATKGNQPANDLLEDVNISWKKVKGGEAIEKMVNAIAVSFDLLHPEKSVEGLVKLYKLMKTIPESNWKTKKLSETKELIQQCSGLFLDATTNEQFAVQTDSLKINFSLNNRLGVDAVVDEVKVDDIDTVFSTVLKRNQNFNFSKTIVVPLSKDHTQPYWLHEKMDEGSYNVDNQLQIGQPDVTPAYTAQVQIKIDNEEFEFPLPVKYKFTDPVKGELYEPVFVVPPATLTTSTNLLLFKYENLQQKDVVINVNANTNLKHPLDVVLKSPDTNMVIRDTVDYLKFQSKGFKFTLNNENQVSAFKYNPKVIQWIDSTYMLGKMSEAELKKSRANNEMHSKTGQIYSFARPNDSVAYFLAIRSINYDHIPAIKYFYPDVIKQVHLSIKTEGKKIGYIPGAGDKVPAALEQMGYEITLLTEKELAKNNLQEFDAIITGVRAYNTNDWMGVYYEKLMKYVADGGNMIVQYNTSNFISNVATKIGPYNFTISRIRVTDENAAVKFLKPEHPVLNFPNKITQNDFEGWIQERSIYHASNWDRDKFETIFSMHDKGEKDDEGSLIIAKYGKGYFTYTGLVFFRELPAGVPGAYRLLANIIALNVKKGF